MWDESAHGFAQKPFGPVPVNSCSHRPSRRHTDPYMRDFSASLVMSLHYQHNKRVGIGLAGTPHPLEIFGVGQTELSLHPYSRTCSKSISAYQRTFFTCLLAVTVN